METGGGGVSGADGDGVGGGGLGALVAPHRATPAADAHSVQGGGGLAAPAEASAEEDDPLHEGQHKDQVHGGGYPVPAAVNVEERSFYSRISQYVDSNQWEELEMYLKGFMPGPIHESSNDLEHAAVILHCRTGNIANAIKNQGYQFAGDYFASQILPLITSKSPFVNHKYMRLCQIDRIQASLENKKPLMIEAEKLKMEISDYMRMYLPKEVGYDPAADGLYSKYYEFVLCYFDEKGTKKFRCLLCQSTWLSKPCAFLEKHFQGRSHCMNQTLNSKQRYVAFSNNIQGKRKPAGSVLPVKRLKQVKVSHVQENVKPPDQDIPQLLTEAQKCVMKLAGLYANENNDLSKVNAFATVQTKLFAIFSSIGDRWNNYSHHQYPSQGQLSSHGGTLAVTANHIRSDLPGQSWMYTEPRSVFQSSDTYQSQGQSSSHGELAQHISSDLPGQTWMYTGAHSVFQSSDTYQSQGQSLSHDALAVAPQHTSGDLPGQALMYTQPHLACQSSDAYLGSGSFLTYPAQPTLNLQSSYQNLQSNHIPESTRVPTNWNLVLKDYVASIDGTALQGNQNLATLEVQQQVPGEDEIPQQVPGEEGLQ